MRRSNFKFSDSQMQFNHDFRLFAVGAEITRHIRGALTITRTDRNSPSTFSFELDNVGDKFLVLPENKGYEKLDNGDFKKLDNVTSYNISSTLSATQISEIAKLQDKQSSLPSIIESDEYSLSEEQAKLLALESTKSYTDYNDWIKKPKTNKKKLESNKYKKQLDVVNEAQNKLNADKKSLSVTNSRLNNLSYDKETNSVYTSGNFNTNTSNTSNTTTNTRTTNNTTFISNEIVHFSNYDLFSDELYLDNAKQLIYLNKQVINAQAAAFNFSKDTSIKPYDLNIYTCILEKNDPIRFFIKDPCSPFDTDKWIPMFSGFIQNITDHTDYLTGEKYFTIQCCDIRGLMQNMRVQTNPRISHGTNDAYMKETEKAGQNIGVFSDFYAQGSLGGVDKGTKYIGKPFDKIVIDYLTGSSVEQNFYDEESKSFVDDFVGKVISSQSNEVCGNEFYASIINNKKRGTAIGCCLPGLKLCLSNFVTDKEKCVSELELWQDLLVFGIKGDYYTFDEVTKIGDATIPYGEFDPYNCFFHFLAPEKGSGASNIYDSQMQDLAQGFEYQTRFEFMSQLCEKIDYQWFTNSMGDIVVEFPMYDFNTNAFGAYQDSLEVNNHLVNTSINEITDNIVSAVSVTGGVTSVVGNIQGAIQYLYSAFAKCDSLAVKYGLNVETISVPFMQTDTSSKRLEKQAAIELIKRNILATSMEMEIAYRYSIFPNKPMLNVDKCRLGVTNSFTYTFTVNEGVSCGVGLFYIRKKNENNKYITLFNGENLPIHYNGVAGNSIDTSDVSETGIDVLTFGPGE